MMPVDIQDYKKQLTEELSGILHYWMHVTVDKTQDGFYGKIDENNIAHPDAPKGLVLNARILYSFSAAYNQTRYESYLPVAQRAFQYLLQHFTDAEYGGLYWSVDAQGKPLSDRKQMYGLAFGIYGLSEYYAATQDDKALQAAVDLFKLIEEYSYDKEQPGYFEAFTRDWQPPDDLRLSEKDENESKTMNTHLHIIEAYANLYKVWPDAFLHAQLIGLLSIFDEHIIDKNTGHLHLFFNDGWQAKPAVISYGHDIEAAWLLLQCAEIAGNEYWINTYKIHAMAITNAAAIGLDTDGGLWYEYDMVKGRLIKEKHWWPQAEAMVGFFNAWQLSSENSYLQQSYNSWQFVKKYLKDNTYGEWFWGVYEDYSTMPGEDKAGFWKCPYHNSRACMELIKRIN